MPVISVDGIIGAGKTTLIDRVTKYLKENGVYDNVVFVSEPVSDWQKRGIFELFYANRNRWAFTFQLLAFHSRVQVLRELSMNDDRTLYILERSIFTDKIFATVQHKLGNINEMEFQIYNELWEMWASLVGRKIDRFIYLRTPIEICQQRVASRDRAGEIGVTTPYQQKLLEEHENFFINLKADCIIIDDGKIAQYTPEQIQELAQAFVF